MYCGGVLDQYVERRMPESTLRLPGFPNARSGTSWAAPVRLESPELRTRRQAGYFQDRPDFDGALARRWNPSRDADRLVEVLGLNQVEAAQLLARLRKWAVGH